MKFLGLKKDFHSFEQREGAILWPAVMFWKIFHSFEHNIIEVCTAIKGGEFV